jgi:hypothetical protein
MPRTLTIFFPDGKTEYWLTALVFDAGDKLDHNGGSWIVTSVGGSEGDGDGRHLTVTVRPHSDGDSRPSQDGNFAKPS